MKSTNPWKCVFCEMLWFSKNQEIIFYCHSAKKDISYLQPTSSCIYIRCCAQLLWGGIKVKVSWRGIYKNGSTQRGGGRGGLRLLCFVLIISIWALPVCLSVPLSLWGCHRAQIRIKFPNKGEGERGSNHLGGEPPQHCQPKQGDSMPW